MNWLVGYTVDENKRLGIEAHERIIAAFEVFVNAEDFILKCMPKENLHHFFIKNQETGERMNF